MDPFAKGTISKATKFQVITSSRWSIQSCAENQQQCVQSRTTRRLWSLCYFQCRRYFAIL